MLELTQSYKMPLGRLIGTSGHTSVSRGRYTLLHPAVEGELRSVARVLLEYKADPGLWLLAVVQ